MLLQIKGEFMADEKPKASPLEAFRKRLADRGELVSTIQEGLKSTNAKVRALAIKWAHKTQEHDFVKKHVMSLLKDEKTKRVYRTISKKINRSTIKKKLEELTKASPKKEAKAEAASAPAAEQKS